MAHINITYQMLEHIFKLSMNGMHIIRVKPHPFLARTLMAEFHGPEELNCKPNEENNERSEPL